MTKVRYFEKQDSEEQIHSNLNPIVSKWFKQKFKNFTEAQKYSLLAIKNRKNILVS